MPQRVFVGASTVTLRVSLEDGTLTAATVSVTGAAHDGSTVTLGAVGNPSTGVYQASLTVAQPTLVTLTWLVNGAAQVDTVEVQSAPYVTVDELRSVHASLASLSGVACADAVQDAEAEAMMLTQQAWRRRYDVEELPVIMSGGVEAVRLPWPHVRRIGKATRIEPDGTQTVLASSQWELLPHGVLEVAAEVGDRVEVGFEHGRIEPHREIRRAVLTRARQLAQADVSKVPLYSERVVMDGQGSTMVRLLPGAMSTGVAEVDAVYRRHAYAAGAGIA